jgi:hypothetical protein
VSKDSISIGDLVRDEAGVLIRASLNRFSILGFTWPVAGILMDRTLRRVGPGNFTPSPSQIRT